MNKLNTIFTASILISLIGCASSPQKPAISEAEIIPPPVPEPVVIETEHDAEPAMNWITTQSGVVKHEEGYRHVIVTEALPMPVIVAEVEPITPAAIEAKPLESQADNNEQEPRTLPVALVDNSPNEEALMRALAAADDIDSKEGAIMQENKNNKAWSKHCLHGALTREESHIIETTKMPEYLVRDCIPHK